MEGNPERRHALDEPHGFVAPTWVGGPAPWRRVIDWLAGARDDIDQRGLLAERTLVPPAPRGGARSPGEPRVAARRDD